MATTTDLGGPVSAALAEDVKNEVRRQGIVVWLDKQGHFTPFVDRLAEASARGDVPFAVRAFRGSFLELLLALDGQADGLDKSLLLLHVPGHNEETIRTTPLLELYLAGTRYRKALETAVTEAAAGRARSEQLAAFLAESGDGLTLEKADAWLGGLLAAPDASLAKVLEAVSLPALVDDLLSRGFAAARLEAPGAAGDAQAVAHVLSLRTGMDEAWKERAVGTTKPRAADLAFAVASWALAVEFVHDLKHPPRTPALLPMAALPAPLVEACRGLAKHLRDRHAELYASTADETEEWLDDDRRDATADDLGKIDTFRFEEDRLLAAGLDALRDREWKRALDWAKPRLDGGSFWLKTDAGRRAAWELVADAALLGAAIAEAGPTLGDVHGLEGAVERYVKAGAAVDGAHRRLEQRRTALLFPQLPRYEALRAQLDALRQQWRTWADAWARDFNRACRSWGFLPPPELQQRMIFDQVVRPLTNDAPTAYFVIDAFRYEMGEALRAAIEGTPATHAHLRARLAELPSVTEIGMNALAPVAVNGRLRPVVKDATSFRGLKAGEFQVITPENRKRAMAERVGGATCPWLTLEEAVNRDADSLRRSVASARLVVVHSREIDEAGENGMGTAVFDLVMQRLRAAWKLLREAGIRRFVFTADHGFLLLDEATQSVQAHGRKIDPKRRHVVSTVAADHTGEVRVPMADLGYEDVPGLHLMFPETTALFDTGGSAPTFVHGGNSPQERVIPVLVVEHRAAAGADTQTYAISARASEGIAGMHCIALKVEPVAQDALPFGRARELELALRVPEIEGVSVELCQARLGARLEGGTVRAPIDREVEVFFKLTGAGDARVRVEVHHPGGGSVAPCLVDARFAVAPRGRGGDASLHSSGPAAKDWLKELPDGVRQLFEHLDQHRSATEAEAIKLLGGASQARRFANRFEEYAAKVPFECIIETSGGTKRYKKVD